MDSKTTYKRHRPDVTVIKLRSAITNARKVNQIDHDDSAAAQLLRLFEPDGDDAAEMRP